METTKGHGRGVKCGNCSTREAPVYHKHAAAVRKCYEARYAEQEELHAQQQAELAAEARAERYWEEGTSAQQMAYLGELEQEAQALGGQF